jgi:hypothetical protein
MKVNLPLRRCLLVFLGQMLDVYSCHFKKLIPIKLSFFGLWFFSDTHLYGYFHMSELGADYDRNSSRYVSYEIRIATSTKMATF